MALGFGFNKAKVLSAAEKYVQQGKFNNAIAEYEKVIRQDPKDLTVLNTVGDLYARLGRTDQATQCFRKVGEAYANDGFTVKAIALYKKVTKLTPGAIDCMLKLAELYTQQGLYNDARAQYVHIADHHLKAGNNDQAGNALRKLLEFDPDNTAMQSRLADLYVKMGKPEEARSIFFHSAESHFKRGSKETADQALERVLQLDPNFVPALMLRGQVNSDLGQHEAAIECLEKLTDIDSRPDCLRALLRSHLSLKRLEDAMPLATKLLAVHNDLSGITACADRMMSAGEFEAALRLYAQHAERLLAANTAGLLEALNACIDRVKENAAALEILRSIYQKAGENTHLNEVNELLAHALVQGGELARARDIYKELADLEPENPVHNQNYKQVMARMGDSALRPLSPEEGAQAFMVDELAISAPELRVEYGRDLANAIQSAITDAELLDSYNLPKKALAPLEAVLPQAPLDPELNQRLASLYARAERFSDAAQCCDVLRAVYWKAGHSEHALRYADMAEKYRERIGEKPADLSVEAILARFETQEAPAPPAAPEPEARKSAEIDISHEWESLASQAPTEAESAASPDEGTSQFISAERALAGHLSAVGDLVEEIRFYLSQGMTDEAQAAIDRCAVMAPELTELDALRQELAAVQAKADSVPEVEIELEDQLAVDLPMAAAEAALEEITFDTGEPKRHVPEPVRGKPGPVEVPPVREWPDMEPLEQPLETPPLAAARAAHPQVAKAAPAAAAHSTDSLNDLVLDLEESLGADFDISRPKPAPAATIPASAMPGPKPMPVAAAVPAQPPAPVKPEAVMPPPAAVAKAQPAQAGGNGNGQKPETVSMLADLFEEFKGEVEEEAATEKEDPETHYNLGIAFREMGLLDEAIGELQKVCHAIETGNGFNRQIETYTWLAQCLVDKGAPQAAIKWYESALRVAGVTSDVTTAVHYDMGNAFEAAGNTRAALDHFMEVYGTNIDYRDVAERIKTLQSVVKS